MATMLIDVCPPAIKAGGTRLTLTEDGAVFLGTDDAIYPWESITRLKYGVVRRHLNGAYMCSEFAVQVGDLNRFSQCSIRSARKLPPRSEMDGEDSAAIHSWWEAVVAIIEKRVCRHLVTAAVNKVHHGGSATVSGIRFDRQGIREAGLFGSEVVAWTDFARVEQRDRHITVLARHGNRTKARIQVSDEVWNHVLLSPIAGELSKSFGIMPTTDTLAHTPPTDRLAALRHRPQANTRSLIVSRHR